MRLSKTYFLIRRAAFAPIVEQETRFSVLGNCKRNAKNRTFHYITCQNYLVPWIDRLSGNFCWSCVVLRNLWVWFDLFMMGWRLELVLMELSPTKYLLIMKSNRVTFLRPRWLPSISPQFSLWLSMRIWMGFTSNIDRLVKYKISVDCWHM